MAAKRLSHMSKFDMFVFDDEDGRPVKYNRGQDWQACSKDDNMTAYQWMHLNMCKGVGRLYPSGNSMSPGQFVKAGALTVLEPAVAYAHARDLSRSQILSATMHS